MKTTIKVKVAHMKCVPTVMDKGDWIDLHSAASYECHKGEYLKIGLGVSVELPAGYEAVLASRSSLYEKKGLYNPGGIGVIDNCFNGDADEWKLPVFVCRRCNISAGERIAQFRIRLSQKATWWQRLKWLFTNGVEIKVVERLGNGPRGGFGSTGGYDGLYRQPEKTSKR